MADNDGKGFSLPWGNITALIAAIAGSIALLYDPITSSRPPLKATRAFVTTADQDVDARLWQDPLRLAQDHQAREKSSESSGAETAKPGEAKVDRLKNLRTFVEGFADVAPNSEERLLILPVMVTGGPYVESAEKRLRARQAVLTALGAEQFVPKDGEHIGYFELPIGDEASRRPGNLLVPFEQFRAFGTSAGREFSQVLVLWVCDDTLEASPLAVLVALGKNLNWKNSGVSLRVLGPSSSSGVYSMLQEIEQPAIQIPPQSPAVDRAQEVSQYLENVEMTSPMATVEEEAFRYVPDPTDPKNENVSERLKHALKIDFHRTILTDDQVAAELAAELKLRRIKLAPHDTTQAAPVGTGGIALIAEWDTLYGRVLPLTFTQELWEVLKSEDETHETPDYGELIGSKANWPSPIERFYYLRGIDGRSPEEGKESKKAEASPTDRERPSTTSEATEGENQADYLRRLAGLLKQRHEELIRGGRGGFKAIGVLGSDIYDKLMVLRALRKEFPGVLFFSNNLDARMAIPEESRATRNLLVASPFGLQLHPSLQAQSAPFRDSYQTSMYAGTRYALGPRLASRDFQQEIPRIFEISRNGPFDLSRQSPLSALVPRVVTGAISNPAVQLFPARPDQEHWILNYQGPISSERRSIWVMFGMLLAGVIVMIVFTSGWIGLTSSHASACEDLCGSRNTCAQPGKRRKIRDSLVRAFSSTRVMLLVGALIAGAWMGSQWIWDDGDGEPFALFSGISSWPTLILQVIAAVLAIHFLFRAILELAGSQKDVGREIGPLDDPFDDDFTPQDPVVENEDADSRKRRKARQGSCTFINRSGIGWRSKGIRPFAKEPILIPQIIWKEYLHRGAVKPRLIHTISMAFMVVFIGILIAHLSPPPVTPFRGETNLPGWMFLIALIAGTILTLYTYTAIRLHSDLVHLFNLGRTKWPARITQASSRAPFLSYRALCEYLDVRLIAVHSEAAVKIVQYPFLIMVLLVISTSSYFDNWSRPPGLLLIYCFNLGMAVVAAITLARAAEKARQRALRNLRRERIREMAAEAPDHIPGERRTDEPVMGGMYDSAPGTAKGNEAEVPTGKVEPRVAVADRPQRSLVRHNPGWQATRMKVLDEVISEVEALHRGALAPMWEQPVFRAILYSSGSLGLGSLLQNLPRFL